MATEKRARIDSTPAQQVQTRPLSPVQTRPPFPVQDATYHVIRDGDDAVGVVAPPNVPECGAHYAPRGSWWNRYSNNDQEEIDVCAPHHPGCSAFVPERHVWLKDDAVLLHLVRKKRYARPDKVTFLYVYVLPEWVEEEGEKAASHSWDHALAVKVLEEHGPAICKFVRLHGPCVETEPYEHIVLVAARFMPAWEFLDEHHAEKCALWTLGLFRNRVLTQRIIAAGTILYHGTQKVRDTGTDRDAGTDRAWKLRDDMGLFLSPSLKYARGFGRALKFRVTREITLFVLDNDDLFWIGHKWSWYNPGDIVPPHAPYTGWRRTCR